MKLYYSGVSGRGVGKLLGMNKSNVHRWIQKNQMDVDNFYETMELDELYWFIKRKPRTKTRENVYIITMVRREPRQIVCFDVAFNKSPDRIQEMVDSAPFSHRYCTDGYSGYVDVIYPGKHIRNIRDKNNSFTVEGINADWRHYLPIRTRRSRCFARKLETLQAVIEVFIHAYNAFGHTKHEYRQSRPVRVVPFSIFDFLSSMQWGTPVLAHALTDARINTIIGHIRYGNVSIKAAKSMGWIQADVFSTYMAMLPYKGKAMNAKHQRTTIRDVAREAQVAISTVSRYLNRSGYVDGETARRIAEAIDRTNFVPSIAASSLKRQRSRIILLVVPDICNPFYSSIAKTAQQLVGDRGYVMALYDSDESGQEIAAVGMAQQMYASGILFASLDIKPDVIEALLGSNIPVVGLNAYAQYPFDTVHVHGVKGTYLAVQHLLERGHRQIAFAGGTPDTMIGKSRRGGYEMAMREAGLSMPEAYVIEEGFAQADGYRMGQRLSGLSPLPTAVCCANDQIALGLISAMYEHGIWVPQMVSVTGMDDIPYARISNPGLTTVTNDSVAFSREGVRMLFERIDGTYEREPRDVAIPHALIVRASTREL